MRKRTAKGFAALVTGGMALVASAAAAEPPPMVAAYSQQLVRQCGGDMTPALAAQVVQQIDLNGDKIDDWIIDAGRYPCPNHAVAFKDAGSQVTVFLGRADGRALPAFQRIAYGSRIEAQAQHWLCALAHLGRERSVGRRSEGPLRPSRRRGGPPSIALSWSIQPRSRLRLRRP